MVIRYEPISLPDIPELQRLANEIWRACFTRFITPEQIEFMLDWMYGSEQLTREIEGDYIWEFIVVDDVRRGYISTLPKPAESQLYLNKLYLDSALQGQGLSKALLQHVADSARDLGLGEVRLNCNKGNTPALRAYERFGFQTIDSVVDDIGNGFVMDDYVLTYTVP